MAPVVRFLVDGGDGAGDGDVRDTGGDGDGAGYGEGEGLFTHGVCSGFPHSSLFPVKLSSPNRAKYEGIGPLRLFPATLKFLSFTAISERFGIEPEKSFSCSRRDLSCVKLLSDGGMDPFKLLNDRST